MINKFTLIMLIALCTLSSALAGVKFKGRVVEAGTNDALGTLNITVKEQKLRTKSNSDGVFSFDNIEPGKYTFIITGVGLSQKEYIVEIENKNYATPLDIKVVLRELRANEIEVYSSSRRLQKITEAPSSISVVSGKQIEMATSHGQIGKVLEHIQGVDVTQSGLNDFNINTRGFNNSINRRMLVLIDGRDPSTPMLNLLEWNSFQTNMADVNKIEVVRGPGSALFGQNAYNGVINIQTNAPKDVLGTRLSVTGGDFNTIRADLRNAGKITDNLYYKANVGYSSQRQIWVQSRDTSRGGTIEYRGLVPDARGNRVGIGQIQNIDSLINENRNAYNYFGTARLDYELSPNEFLIGEVGFSKYGGEYFVNQTGRILINDIEKPFARIAYNSKNINVQAHWTKRFAATPQIVMNAAATSGENSNVFVVDAQWNDSYLNDDLKLVVGANHEEQSVISASAGSALLLVPDSLRNNFTGVYAQAEYSLLKNLQLVGAARFDRSSLFENQFSPKAAIVWTPDEGHTLRATFNRSFLRPSYSDYFRRSPAGPPVTTYRVIDSAIAAQFGVNQLGLNSLSQWNNGNVNINVESAMSYEIGYKGVISNSVFVTADVYYNRRSNFISNPLGGFAPEVYKPLQYKNADGSINEQANNALRDSLAKRQGTAPQNPYERLASDPFAGGAPALIVTPKNIAVVAEYGVELGVNYYFDDNLSFNANYTYLGINVEENQVSQQSILPNTSPNRVNFGVEYDDKKAFLPFNVAMNVRGVQGFEWIAGFFKGYVPEYWVVNLNGSVNITKEMRLGFNVFNLLNRRHYQIFGGTYLERYATASLSYTF